MAYTCPRCGAMSHNPNDEARRFCGACNRFEDDVDLPANPVSRCYLCKKEDSGNTGLCDCEAGATCDVCKDQLHTCQDCGGLEYCGECFHKREHNLCSPPEKFHPDHLPDEVRWCRLCQAES